MSKWVDKNEWPFNIYKAIVPNDERTEENLPADYRGALEYVLIATLKEREAQILRYRYQMGLTYRVIGEKVGLGAERIRQIHDKAIRRLRHPSRLRFLRDGIIPEMERYRANCRDLFFNQGYREGYRNGSMDARANLQNDSEPENDEAPAIPIEQAPLDILDPSVRVFNCLRRVNICTVGQLLSWSKTELMRIRNFGQLSLLELEQKLDKFELKLRDE